MAETVSVALRLPAGLVIEHAGARYLLNGWNHGVSGMQPNREKFGITDGVPKALFDGWYAEQIEHGTDLIKNDLVFANANAGAIRDQALERMRNVRSGFEGLNPDDPMPGEKVKLEPTDETRKMLDENAGKA